MNYAKWIKEELAGNESRVKMTHWGNKSSQIDYGEMHLWKSKNQVLNESREEEKNREK